MVSQSTTKGDSHADFGVHRLSAIPVVFRHICDTQLSVRSIIYSPRSATIGSTLLARLAGR